MSAIATIQAITFWHFAIFLSVPVWGYLFCLGLFVVLSLGAIFNIIQGIRPEKMNIGEVILSIIYKMGPIAMMTTLLLALIASSMALERATSYGLMIFIPFVAVSGLLLFHMLACSCGLGSFSFATCWVLLSLMTGRWAIFPQIRRVMNIQEGDCVADIGAGVFSFLTVKRGQCLYMAIDIAPLAAKVNRWILRRFRGCNAYSILVDARDLSFRNKSFDKMVAINSVCMTEDAATEIHRVLKRKGRLYVAMDGPDLMGQAKTLQGKGFKLEDKRVLWVMLGNFIPIPSGRIYAFKK